MELNKQEIVHVVVVCFPGDQGHINPFLRFSKMIASKGLLVTFTTNLSSARLMSAAAGGDTPSPITAGDTLSIGDGFLRFEFFDDGSDMSSDPLDVFVEKLETAGPAAFESLIRRQSTAVSHIVGDPFLPLVAGVADKFNIHWSLLWVPSFAVFSVYYRYYRFPELFPADDGDWEGVKAELPGLPPLNTDEVPTHLFPDDIHSCLRRVMLQNFANLSPATWVLFETFEELESPAFVAANTLLPPPAKFLPIGPLANIAGKLAGPAGNLYKSSEEAVDWLDTQPAGSVLYVAFGSVNALPQAAAAEMARGLKESRRRFLWVLRSARGMSETGVTAGFEAEVAGIGKLVQWCPQEKVLRHPSVGAFLTHCGWNSTLEAVVAGKPVVALPMCGDQMTNAKFLVEVYRIGVRMKEVTVAEVVRCADEVFDGDGAAGRREAAERWREKAAAAVVAGGSSALNLEMFVEYVISGCDLLG